MWLKLTDGVQNEENRQNTTYSVTRSDKKIQMHVAASSGKLTKIQKEQTKTQAKEKYISKKNTTAENRPD